MPLLNEDIIEAIGIIADNANIRVTVKGSMLGGLLAGTAATVGGLLMGPAGLAVGGAAGGCAAAYIAKDSFKPISRVIAEDLTPAQRNQLVDSVRITISNVNATDAAGLVALVASSDLLRGDFEQAITSFITQQLSLNVAR